MITITIVGNGIARLADATAALGSAKAQRAYSMALNKTAGRVNTQVKRAIAKQMGVSQAAVVKHGGLRVRKASPGNLVATIDSSGKFLPLKDFGPSQRRKGVSANPWGRRIVFTGTWIDKGKAGGHVFKNTGKFNKVSGRFNAIEALWGPAVPREMVRDESAATFHRVAAEFLPTEVDRAIRVLSKGAFSR